MKRKNKTNQTNPNQTKTPKKTKPQTKQNQINQAPSQPNQTKPNQTKQNKQNKMEPIKKQVSGIYFTLMSPEEIKKMAQAKVVTPELYDMDGYPVDGGLMDLRLGAIDPGVRCRTCGGKLKECLGHFGYIELARPVLHIKYVAIIERLLRCFCHECGKVLLTEQDASKSLKARITKARNAKKCPYCSTKQPKVKLEKPSSIYVDGARIFPSAIRTVLSKISQEDTSLLGISPNMKIENAIITLLLVPPVTARPSITLETGERSEDDLTHKLSDIVRANQRLWENLNAGAPEVIIEDLWDLLQYHVTTFFDNTISQVPPSRHRSGQPLKTLSERIKGKEGRIRHNLAGKRVDFSSRTVISSDPFIGIDEVGIPKEIATTLTVHEKINSTNKKYLIEYVKNGPKKYPGANYIIRPDGKKKRITEEVKEELLGELDVGYYIERHLQDGDIVLFNRHPSLHRMSLMAHYVKILPGRTFRMNPAATFPYNADFDGDEMNVHAPQTKEARSEAIQLLDIKNHIITPKNATNVLGCIEDAITGNYILTSGMVLLKQEAVQLLSESGVVVTPGLIKKWPKIVDGKEVFSALLPKVNVKTSEVTIKDGKLVKGEIDVKSVGIESGALILELTKHHSNKEVIKILEKIFRLGCVVLVKYGFSVGLSDIEVENADSITKEIIDDSYNQVSQTILDYYEKNLLALPGKNLEETREIEISQILNAIRTKISGRISSQLTEKGSENPVDQMIFSGARGSVLNRIQMGALVGQQILWGKRVDIGFKRRTLAHFKQHDLMPESLGFVASSFYSGLSPSEFFFSAITGRDSLMDTALRTPKSGYLYRRLTNALQDVKSEYDGTVRDGGGNIVQFIYGRDGMSVDRAHAKGKITPGEAIGIITAQSFGEPSTQMTLNVFHFAGVAEFAITLGLPRLIELFDARKNPKTPVMEIHLKQNYNNETSAWNVAAKIKEITLDNVTSEVRVNWTDKKIEILLDKKRMRELRLTGGFIAAKLQSNELGVRESQEGLTIRPKGKDFEFKELYMLKEKMKAEIVRGVKGIKEVLPIKREGERDYVILTYGSNLKEILDMKEVDNKKTKTNNIHEIANTLGIEAGRQAIIEETKSVIEKQGIDIDMKHIMLVADLMTASGDILGVTRTGIIKEKGSILARASFETPIKHFVNATLSGEKDILASVIENVILNQPVPVGTGLPGLMVKVGAPSFSGSLALPAKSGSAKPALSSRARPIPVKLAKPGAKKKIKQTKRAS